MNRTLQLAPLRSATPRPLAISRLPAKGSGSCQTRTLEIAAEKKHKRNRTLITNTLITAEAKISRITGSKCRTVGRFHISQGLQIEIIRVVSSDPASG
jgi:hypothetical protein